MDSEISGQFGFNLIHNLFPFKVSKYKGGNSPEKLFTDSCSTGGWVSLAFQLFLLIKFAFITIGGKK